MGRRRKAKPAPPPNVPVTVDEHRGGPHGLERYEPILPPPAKHV